MKLKRIISTALAAIMLAGTVATGATAAETDKTMNFTDVTEGKWFYDAVKYVFDRDLMEGKSEGKFAPTEDLTRAQFVTIIGRFAGVDDSAAATDTFSDTKKDTWYSPYIGWAVEKGIVTGYSDNTFRPGNSMTRQEMATVISRYIASEGINMPRENTAPDEFTDEANIASWAAEHVEVLRRAGVVSGKGGDNFEPKAQIKRSETAQIIMNLIEARDKAWQGYQPDPESDSMILGAKYLYWGGTVVAGSLGTDLDESGSYPTLTVYTDELAEKQAYNQLEGVTGVSLNLLGHDYESMPIVKICYKYDSDVTDALSAVISYRYSTDYTDALTLTPGQDDDGFKTAYVDLSASLKSHSDLDLSYYFTHLLFDPFAGDEADGFEIRYIGFFSDMSSAEAFKSESQADYLKNYFLYSPLDYNELTSETEDDYEQLIYNRVNEILSSDSALTPDMFDADKTYYISSINGDDSNDGKTPETAWKTLSKLSNWKANNTVEVSAIPEGGAVFFERGSVFYGERYNDQTMTCLAASDGISFGAYGEGDKPLFSLAIDFTDTKNGNGNWIKTEWDNVWVLDEIDPVESFCKENQDIGSIIFNDGQYYGIRLKPTTDMAAFGTPGMTTVNVGFCTNGMEYFVSGGTSYETPGTALKNNLEYIHDREGGKLYLYWDGNNPADDFEDIKVSRLGYCSSTGSNIHFDNLAFLHSSTYGISPGEENITFTNCEVGFCNKSLRVVASGIERYGKVDGFTVENCYFHEVGDGPMSLQCGGQENHENIMQNVRWENNVVLTSGCGVELWNYIMPNAELDENGHANYSNMRNVLVRGNILAYVGHGLSQLAGQELLAGHAINSSLTYAATENVVLEDNLIYKPYDKVFLAYMATDTQDKGWDTRGNTYVANPEFASMAFTYENVNDMDSRFFKYRRVYIPYNERYLTYLTANGVDPKGTYYYYTGMTDAERQGCFFTSSYYIERGLEFTIN